MVSNANRTNRIQRIRITCPCGNRLSTKAGGSANKLRCPSCGKIIDLSQPYKIAENSSPRRDKHAEDDNGTKVFYSLWLLVGVVALAIVLFISWDAYSSYRSRVAAIHKKEVAEANTRISKAVDAANEMIAGKSFFDEEKIENDLVAAITDENATEITITTGEEALKKLRQWQEDRARQVRIQESQQKAEILLETAKDKFKNKDVSDGIKLLKDYLEHPHANEKEEIKQLLTEAELANSDRVTLEALNALNDDEFNKAKTHYSIPDGKVKNEALIAVRADTIKRNLDSAIERRAKIGKAQDRIQAEKDKLKAEQERLKREEEKRMEMERVIRAQLPFASLEDIADYPERYVGLTYQFDVWIQGSDIHRYKSKNYAGEYIIDGYLLSIKSAKRDPHKADPIGNGNILMSDRLNPYIASNDVARGLKDKLSISSYHKMRITFTVNVVNANPSSFGSPQYAFLAEITKLELPK